MCGGPRVGSLRVPSAGPPTVARICSKGDSTEALAAPLGPGRGRRRCGSGHRPASSAGARAGCRPDPDAVGGDQPHPDLDHRVRGWAGHPVPDVGGDALHDGRRRPRPDGEGEDRLAVRRHRLRRRRLGARAVRPAEVRPRGVSQVALRAAIPYPSWRSFAIPAVALVLTVAVAAAPAVASTGLRAQGQAAPSTTTPSQQPAQPPSENQRLRNRLPSPFANAPTSTAPPQPSGDSSLRDRLPPPFGNGPSFFDIGARINAWFRDLAASALDPLLDLVGRTILATPDLTAAGSRVRELWLVSAGIANTCFVLLIVAGGVLVMSHETIQTSYSVKEIAPRLLVASVAANLSLFLAGQAIPLANALARALLDTGPDPDHVRATLKTLALAPLDTSSGLLIFLAGAPLALVCHALPAIEGLAHLWWRAFAGCLGIQVGQALVLGMAVRLFFEGDRARVLGLAGSGHLVDLIVVGCLLWMLLRIPAWVSRMVFGRRGSTVVRMVKSYVIYRGVRSIGIGR